MTIFLAIFALFFSHIARYAPSETPQNYLKNLSQTSQSYYLTITKSEKFTPFGGIFMVMEQFDSMLSSVIDSTLGQRCSIIGYQFSEIVRSLMSVYFCGGSCVEDVTSHLMRHLSYHPTLRTCSSDTILRAIRELTQDLCSRILCGRL